MKKIVLSSAVAVLALTSTLATAAVGVNHNGAQLNPFAQSNAQIKGNEVTVELVATPTKLNPKEVNPLYKVVSPATTGSTEGQAYSVRVSH
ncbi:hypothetical protein LVJ82_08885 [Vitreoscilla massiliensis]|uniref:Uncharacterized protein n=1 Tax=Vitreoscilla massiliensis TaxID=1689272 RepID=A0ABY4E6G8_9NEIS|nr:hypothetical protein [Vitreoscilla massiliensis]UOO91064.1 hypothetical protein LVJ82_08885 [Vitreoscilla massiliensis]